jgi:hypothetical protein
MHAGSLEHLTPIFMTTHYFVMLTVNIVLTTGINATIDYFMNRDKAPYYALSSATIVNMLLFCIIVSLIIFAGSGGPVHKRIREGQASPVTRRALCDTCFKRVILFSLQEPNWRRRVWLFPWNVIFFPGIPLAIVLSLMCLFASGFSSFGKADACEVSEAANVIVMASWKAVGAGIIFTMAYAAAHNEEQEEIADAVQLIAPLAADGESHPYQNAA